MCKVVFSQEKKTIHVLLLCINVHNLLSVGKRMSGHFEDKK